MLGCLDTFKTGDCGCCGTFPCGCPKPERVERKVRDTRGDCTPVIHGEHLVSSCRKGPDKTVGAPQYALTIENPPDQILRDDDGKPILTADGKLIAKPA